MMNFEISDLSAMKRALFQLCESLESACIPEDAIFKCKLAMNELVVNALRYGGGRAYVRVTDGEREVRLSVRGEHDFVPPVKAEMPASSSERGRGLYLVDALSDRREYSREEGICVTFLF